MWWRIRFGQLLHFVVSGRNLYVSVPAHMDRHRQDSYSAYVTIFLHTYIPTFFLSTGQLEIRIAPVLFHHCFILSLSVFRVCVCARHFSVCAQNLEQWKWVHKISHTHSTHSHPFQITYGTMNFCVKRRENERAKNGNGDRLYLGADKMFDSIAKWHASEIEKESQIWLLAEFFAFCFVLLHPKKATKVVIVARGIWLDSLIISGPAARTYTNFAFTTPWIRRLRSGAASVRSTPTIFSIGHDYAFLSLVIAHWFMVILPCFPLTHNWPRLMPWRRRASPCTTQHFYSEYSYSD